MRKVIFVTIIILVVQALPAKEIIIEPPYDQMEELPVIGFLPFVYSGDAGPEISQKIYEALAKEISDRRLFTPYSVRNLMEKHFGEKGADDSEKILFAFRKEEKKVDFLCHGTVFKTGSGYGVIIKLYPLDPGKIRTYYFRTFTNPKRIAYYMKQIVPEMEARCNRSAEKEILSDKTLYVENFSFDFWDKHKTRFGQEIINKDLSFIIVKGTKYTPDELFFNDLLLYHIHKTRLFKLTDNSFAPYVKNKPAIPPSVDFVISGNIQLSTVSALLNIKIFNGNKSVLLADYKYPMSDISSLHAWNRDFHENVTLAVITLLSNEDMKKMGVVRIETKQNMVPVYYNAYFLGRGGQPNVLMPMGLNIIKANEREYKTFVYPYLYNHFNSGGPGRPHNSFRIPE